MLGDDRPGQIGVRSVDTGVEDGDRLAGTQVALRVDDVPRISGRLSLSSPWPPESRSTRTTRGSAASFATPDRETRPANAGISRQTAVSRKSERARRESTERCSAATVRSPRPAAASDRPDPRSATITLAHGRRASEALTGTPTLAAGAARKALAPSLRMAAA